MKSIKLLLALLITLAFATTASAYSFTRDLELGARGSDVTKLQEMLSGAGYLESDSVTGYFGPATELAVAKWQIANEIKPISGIFGAISRSHVSKVKSENLAASITSTNSMLTADQIKWVADTLLSKRIIKKSVYKNAVAVLTGPRYVIDPPRSTTKLTYPSSGEHIILSYNRLLTRDLSQERSTQPVNWKGLKIIITDTQKLALKGTEITESAVANDEIDFFLLNESGNKMGEILPIFMTGLPKGEPIFVRGLVSSSNYSCSNLSNCGFSVVPAGRYQVLMSMKNTQQMYYSDYFTYKDISSLSNTIEVGSATYKAKMVDDLDIDGCIIPIKIGNNYNVCDYYQNGTAVSRMYGGLGGEYSMNVGDSNKIICNFTENTPVRVEKNMPACVRPASSPVLAPVVRTPIQSIITATPATTTTATVVTTPAPTVVGVPTAPAPVKVFRLNSEQLCAAIKMTTADSCSGYTSYSQRQTNPAYVYNGVTYNLSYTLNKNAEGARCNDLCVAVAK